MPEVDTPLQDGIGLLLRFLHDGALTARVATVEAALVGATTDDLAAVLAEGEITPDLLRAAMLVRTHLGRLNDVIHACAISLALPKILEPGERLARPSLAAGNDPSRPYDVETDRRVAEFKLAVWQGPDAMRKRQVFKDLVHLAADQSGRRAELYVLGERPIRFLTSSKAAAGWALDRSPREARLFQEHFGSLDQPVKDFTAGEGGVVTIINLENLLPDLFAPN